MASFDRSYKTFYWSAIVNTALSATVFKLLRGLFAKSIIWRWMISWPWVHSRSFKPVPFESLGAVSYSPCIVTMVLSCIICEIKRGILVKNRDFFIPLAFGAPVRGGSRRNIAIPFGMEKLEWWGYPMVKKTLRICVTVYTQYRQFFSDHTSHKSSHLNEPWQAEF